MIILGLAAASAGAPLSVAAQPAAPDTGARRAARELADKGFEHYEAGDYAKAIPFLRDAEARFHAPTLLLMLGNAHVKLGKLVEAMVFYDRVASEQLASDAPTEFVNAQTEAKATLASLAPRIATLKIVLKGTTADKVRITIDDVEIPAANVLKPLAADPGTHKIVASIGGDDGGRAVFQSVTLKEGMTKQIQLVFRPGGPVTPPPAAGGCASCEIAAPRGDGEAKISGLAAVALGLVAALRRRRR